MLSRVAAGIAAAMLAASGIGFSDRGHAQLLDEAVKHVAELNTKFAPLLEPTPAEKAFGNVCATEDCDKAPPRAKRSSEKAEAKRMARMDAVVLQIERTVDAYLGRAFDPATVNAKAVESDLARMLGPEYGGFPSAFVIDLPAGRFLLAAFVVPKGMLMGVYGTSVTLRAYELSAQGIRFRNATGNALKGNAQLAASQVHSPNSKEGWFVLWGKMTGANGPNTSMRAYAFDGSEFRTVWAPAYAWGDFKVRETPYGFRVDGNYYRTEKIRHDRYLTSDSGVTRLQGNALR